MTGWPSNLGQTADTLEKETPYLIQAREPFFGSTPHFMYTVLSSYMG